LKKDEYLQVVVVLVVDVAVVDVVSKYLQRIYVEYFFVTFRIYVYLCS